MPVKDPAPRGRKPMATQPMHTLEINPDAVAEMNANTALMHAVQDNYSAERDLINQLLGQVQMAEAFAQFSQTISISKLAYIKENKLYQTLAGVSNSKRLECDGTWESFCRLLGMSDEKANQDIANLKAFGEAALESMSRMGIGYRELRQYRRLPADDQAALAEVAQTGDKEAVLDLAEELIARQNKRNEQLADKLDKRNREYESLAERQTELSEKLDEATARAALLRRITPDKKAQQMLLELQKDMAGARASLRQAMASVEGFQAHLHEHGIADHDEALSALVIEVLNLVLAPLGALDLGGISKPLAHVKHVVG